MPLNFDDREIEIAAKAVAEGLKLGVESERERCAQIASEFLSVTHIGEQLGSITMAEQRTALCVAAMIANRIRDKSYPKEDVYG